MPDVKLVLKSSLETLTAALEKAKQEIKDSDEIIQRLNDKISDVQTEKAIMESLKDEEISNLKKEIERLTQELNTIKTS